MQENHILLPIPGIWINHYYHKSLITPGHKGVKVTSQFNLNTNFKCRVSISQANHTALYYSVHHISNPKTVTNSHTSSKKTCS